MKQRPYLVVFFLLFLYNYKTSHPSLTEENFFNPTEEEDWSNKDWWEHNRDRKTWLWVNRDTYDDGYDRP